MLDALLDSRHLRAGAVEACLDGPERLGLGRLIDANLLDLGLRFAQVREHCVHGGVTLLRGRIAHLRFRIQALQPQRQEFRLQLALFFLERLIATRGRRLPLQVANLLFHLLPQIIQAVQVFARLADAVLGFSASFLVARYTRRFLQECAQIIRTRLDHP